MRPPSRDAMALIFYSKAVGPLHPHIQQLLKVPANREPWLTSSLAASATVCHHGHSRPSYNISQPSC